MRTSRTSLQRGQSLALRLYFLRRYIAPAVSPSVASAMLMIQRVRDIRSFIDVCQNCSWWVFEEITRGAYKALHRIIKNASDACPFERPVRGKELGPTGAALPPHHTHHRLCRRLAQLEKLLFRCADNALWLESEIPCPVLRRRGQTETAEPEDGALTARITLPAERRSGLHGDTRLDIGWNHLVAIGAILSLE